MKPVKPINPDLAPEMIEDEDSFGRFEEMTKRLMRVTKGEIDAREVEYKAEREARRGARETNRPERKRPVK